MNDPVVPRLEFGDNATTNETSSNNEISVSDATKHSSVWRLSAEQRRLHYLYQEYAAVAKDPVEGIYITLSAKNLLEWFGVFIVRSGIYCGGMFRFTMTIPSDFPDTVTMPVVKFDDNIFHPHIRHKTNIVDLGRYFPSGWQRDRNHIYQVLNAVQTMFFRCKTPEPAAAPNPEAALLVRDELLKFKQLARETVRQSRTQIYGTTNAEDENAINFTPWDVELEPFREYLVEKMSSDKLLARVPRCASIANVLSLKTRRRSLSWINADRCQYMCDIFPLVTKQPTKITTQAQFDGNSTNTPLSPDLNSVFAATELC